MSAGDSVFLARQWIQYGKSEGETAAYGIAEQRMTVLELLEPEIYDKESACENCGTSLWLQ